VIIEKPVNAVSLVIKWQGPCVSKDEKATYAADVLSFILDQQTSKFHKNLVESGLAFAANFGYYTLDHTGPITLFAQTSAQNFDACKTAIFKEIDDMLADDYFTEEQLKNAKTILAIDEQYDRERPSNFVHTVGFWWAVASTDYYLNYIENLNKVTRNDIDQYIKTYVIDKPYVMGVLISSEQKEKIGL
jgi:zinc protease